MNNCQSTNLSGTSFKIVPRKSYIQLLEILKARLPESAPFCNAVMLAEAITPSKCNGQDQCTTGTMQFYTYAGSIDNESIVVSSGIVKGSQTESETDVPMAFISIPNGYKMTSELAQHFVTQFQCNDGSKQATTANLYVSPRHITPFITQEILNSGSALQIRICVVYKLNQIKWDEFKRLNQVKLANAAAAGTELRPLNPETDSTTIDSNYSFVFWKHVTEYAKNLITFNPNVGVYSAGGTELSSWAVCYEFGWAGMLFTPEKHRGKNYAGYVMNEIMNQMNKKGLYLLTAVEPNNFKSQKLMAKIGFEKICPMDFIFAHKVQY